MAYKVKRGFRYDGRQRAAGDAFEPKSKRDAQILTAAGKIETEAVAEKREARRGRKPSYETRALESVKVEEPAKVEEPKPTKVEEPTRVEEPRKPSPIAAAVDSKEAEDETPGYRRYQRRDMQAE